MGTDVGAAVVGCGLGSFVGEEEGGVRVGPDDTLPYTSISQIE